MPLCLRRERIRVTNVREQKALNRTLHDLIDPAHDLTHQTSRAGSNARDSMLPPGGLQHLIGLQLVSPFSVLNGTLHLAASVLIKRQPKKIVKEL